MNVWVLHLPEDRLPLATVLEQREETRLHLPFDDMADMSDVHSMAEMRQRVRAANPDMPPESLARISERQWTYAYGLIAEDLLFIPVPSKQVVVVAQVLERASYVGGRYTVPVRWFAKQVPLAKFRRHKEVFVPTGDARMHEVQDPQARLALRSHLPVRANRFARWKWVIAFVILVKLIEYLVQLSREGATAGL